MIPPPGLPHFTYCRPHSKTITPEMQFVVATCRGVQIERGGEIVTIAEGSEFPTDSVSEYHLKCLYEQLKIELMREDHPDYKGSRQNRGEQSEPKRPVAPPIKTSRR